VNRGANIAKKQLKGGMELDCVTPQPNAGNREQTKSPATL